MYLKTHRCAGSRVHTRRIEPISCFPSPILVKVAALDCIEQAQYLELPGIMISSHRHHHAYIRIPHSIVDTGIQIRYERGTLMARWKHRWIAIFAIVGTLTIVLLAIVGWAHADGGTRFGWTGGCWNDSRSGASSTDNVIGEVDVEGIAERYIASYRFEGLAIAEVMEFDNHYYVEVEEPISGRYAFEFLIDRRSGMATPEPGPNMMWNLKYGHMAQGMMGMGRGSFLGSNNDGTNMTLSEEDAHEAAELYLSRVNSELAADHHAAAFYGYYTLHTLRDGHIAGMLSVNGFTGEVWLHTWHGTYLGQLDSETH